MQRSRTRYAPPRSLAAPAGPAQATPACLQPPRSGGIGAASVKGNRGGGSDEVDAAKDRKGQPGITLDPDCKPPWHARRPAGRRDGYGLTLLLTT